LALWRTLAPESLEVAIGWNSLATVEQASGDHAAAERDFRQALRIAKKGGYREGVANFTGNLAGLALNREDWAGAQELAREALVLAEMVGRQVLIGRDCGRLAKAGRFGRRAGGPAGM
jgi:hypothetical protein